MNSVILTSIPLLLGFGIAFGLLLLGVFSRNKNSIFYVLCALLFGVSFVFAVLLGASLSELAVTAVLFMIPVLGLYWKGGTKNEL